MNKPTRTISVSIRRRNQVRETYDLAGLVDLALQLEPEAFDIFDLGEFRGTGHLAAQLDEEALAIWVLKVGQRRVEATLGVARNGLKDAEQFFECTEALIESLSCRDDPLLDRLDDEWSRHFIIALYETGEKDCSQH